MSVKKIKTLQRLKCLTESNVQLMTRTFPLVVGIKTGNYVNQNFLVQGNNICFCNTSVGNYTTQTNTQMMIIHIGASKQMEGLHLAHLWSFH